MPKFTHNWFQDDAKVKFEKYFMGIGPIENYLEIGVCEGASMLWVMEKLKPRYADGVDWWRTGLKVNEKRDKVFQQYKENAYSNLSEYIETDRVNLHEMSSKRFMANCERKYDLIYIDGDHSGNGCMRDIILAYEIMKKDGLMIIDDLQRSTSKKGKYECRLAVDLAAALMMGRLYKEWEDGRQCCFRRMD